MKPVAVLVHWDWNGWWMIGQQCWAGWQDSQLVAKRVEQQPELFARRIQNRRCTRIYTAYMIQWILQSRKWLSDRGRLPVTSGRNCGCLESDCQVSSSSTSRKWLDVVRSNWVCKWLQLPKLRNICWFSRSMIVSRCWRTRTFDLLSGAMIMNQLAEELLEITLNLESWLVPDGGRMWIETKQCGGWFIRKSFFRLADAMSKTRVRLKSQTYSFCLWLQWWRLIIKIWIVSYEHRF